MAKKVDELQTATTDSANVMDMIATGNTKRTLPAGKYRINLVLPEEDREYLERASYYASEPGHLVSITQYLVNLIELDKQEGGLIKYHEGKPNNGKK